MLFDFSHYVTPELKAFMMRPEVLLAAFFISLLTSLARYMSWSGAFYWIFYVRRRLTGHKIQPAWPTKAQIANEIAWSLKSCVIYAVLAVLIVVSVLEGWTKIFFDFSERGVGYAVFSFFLMIIVHDLYFYATHRLSHEVRWLFRRFHRIHHMSGNPSPFADIMFHPVDALIHVGFLPIFIFTIPLHPLVLGLFLLQVQAVNAIGHIGFEVFPDGQRRHPVLRWISRPTAHNLHHSHVQCNYGLYFRFMDRLFKTERLPEDV